MESATAMTKDAPLAKEESNSSTTLHARPIFRSTLPVRCSALSKRKKVKQFQDSFWGFCLCVHFRLIDVNGICCSCGNPMEIKDGRDEARSF